MQSLGVHKVYVLDDQDPFEVPLARIVAGDAERGGHRRSPRTTASPRRRARVFTGEVEKIVASGAQAVFFAGGPGEGTAALLRELHSADPSLLLLGPSTLVERTVHRADRPPRRKHLLTTPMLARQHVPALRPARARRLSPGLRRSRRP